MSNEESQQNLDGFTFNGNPSYSSVGSAVLDFFSGKQGELKKRKSRNFSPKLGLKIKSCLFWLSFKKEIVAVVLVKGCLSFLECLVFQLNIVDNYIH